MYTRLLKRCISSSHPRAALLQRKCKTSACEQFLSSSPEQLMPLSDFWSTSSCLSHSACTWESDKSTRSFSCLHPRSSHQSCRVFKKKLSPSDLHEPVVCRHLSWFVHSWYAAVLSDFPAGKSNDGGVHDTADLISFGRSSHLAWKIYSTRSRTNTNTDTGPQSVLLLWER